jgi:predicted Zn-dependent peptidase
MKMRFLARIAAAAVLLSIGCARRFEVKTVTLESGLRVVVTGIPSPVATALVWLDYGERDGAPGIARIANRMLLGGTEIRTKGQIFREIESAGGWIGAETGLTGSIVVLQAPAEEFTSCFAILCECLSRSTFDSTELAAAAGGEFEEAAGGFVKILRKKARKDSYIRSLLFPDSPAGAPVKREKRPVTADSVAAFAAEHVRPERMIISIAGECDTKSALESMTAAWRGRAVPIPFPPFKNGAAAPIGRPDAKKTGIARSAGPGRRDSLFVAMRTSRPYGEDFLLEYLMGLAIAAKRDGLLSQAAAAGGTGSVELDFYSQNEADYAYWVATAVSPAGTGTGMRSRLADLIADAERDGISDTVFRTAQRRLESAFAIRSQYTLNHAYFGALAERLDLPYQSIFDLQRAAASVTREQLNGRLKDLLPRMHVWSSAGGGR